MKDVTGQNSCESTMLRVMCYNIHGGVDDQRHVDVLNAATIIDQAKADVVALQEVDAERPFHENKNQAKTISDCIGLDYLYFPIEKAERHVFGLAVLSRFPVEQSRFVLLPNLYPWLKMRKRGFIRAVLRTPWGRIHLINTHLSIYKLEQRIQLRAMLETSGLQTIAPNEPLIICGDFNAGPFSLTHSRLSKALTDVQKTVFAAPIRQATFPSKSPCFRIDHIFVSDHFVPLRVEAIKNRQTMAASDHLPLVADLRLIPSE
jgi:endonuclease/exonuclease/phosphatase family metal-dependent hydrolase